MTKITRDIRLAPEQDAHLIGLVMAEQVRRRDKTTAKTTRALLTERLAQLDMERRAWAPSPTHAESGPAHPESMTHQSTPVSSGGSRGEDGSDIAA